MSKKGKEAVHRFFSFFPLFERIPIGKE